MRDWRLSDHIDAFRDGALYAHATAEAIRVVQTHISYVVLTGEIAYKLKKAVNLGFLDFSTLDRRRHFCDEELRLNRTFAPELYLEVVAVFWDGERVSLEPSPTSEVVDYAVKMRQFDDRDLLLRRFEDGELDAALMRRLGRKVAEVHRGTPSMRGDDFGTHQSMVESVDVIKETVQPFVGREVSAPLWESLTGYLGSFLEHHAWLFDMRVKEGWIRECHGDLHLRNICIFEGEIELFDRIEFNDAFKNIDVMYDFAFLLMDLRYRGRGDLANAALNAYAEETGDYSGVILLPFYECVRALIRGEVALLLSADDSAGTSTRETARDDAARYFEYAQGYATRGAGGIIVVCGVSGTGKSTFARALTERGDFIHIRSDAIRKHVAGIPLGETDESLYTEAHTMKTYGHLIELGVLLSERGNRVILDAQFARRGDRAKLLEKARAFDVPVRFVECDAPENVVRQRLDAREGDVSDATAELVPMQRDAFEPFGNADGAVHTRLDTTDSEATKALVADLTADV